MIQKWLPLVLLAGTTMILACSKKEGDAAAPAEAVSTPPAAEAPAAEAPAAA